MYSKKVLDNFYYRYVEYDKRLKYMPYASAGVNTDEHGNIILISYSTLVCVIDKNGFLRCNGLYSNTTRRHISAFIREYAPLLTYKDVKKCYDDNIAININTGEVIKNASR